MSNLENIKHEGNLFYVGEFEDPKAYIKVSDVKDNTISILSTFVSPDLRGMGMAGKLTKEVAEYARKNELKVNPVCSYAVKFFEENTEYADLIG